MNLGMPELIFLFILGLLLFGPEKLPKIGREVGKALGEFKRASQEFQNQLNEEVRQLESQQESERSIAPPDNTTPRATFEAVVSSSPQTDETQKPSQESHG